MIDKKQIRLWLEKWETNEKKIALFYGKPGTGKTTTAHSIAKELGYTVLEFNASDDRAKDFFLDLKDRVQLKGLEDVVYLFDEADGLKKNTYQYLEDVLLVCKHPVIITANDIFAIPQSIRELCYQVDFRVRPSEIIQVAAKEGGLEGSDVLRDAVPDFRQAKLLKYGSQGYRPRLTKMETLQQALKMGNLDEIDFQKDQLVVLLDNAPKFYGIELVRFIDALVLADNGAIEALHGIKTLQKLEASYFYDKYNTVKGRQKFQTDSE